MIVVYLSNQNIRIVEGEYSKGSVKIKGLHHVVDTQGMVINGSVTDKEGLQALLKELWEREKLPRKDVALVINSNQFTTRILDVPVMKPAQTMEYIKREFADVERIEDPVHSYFPMPGPRKGKVQKVFAGVASRGFLKVYQELFAEIGIQLSRIEVVLSALIRMLDALESIKGHTSIVQLVSETTLINALYVKGEHVYSSRVRLFSDVNTPEYAVEAARSVSNILQFAKSQNIEETIQEVYVAGMESETMEVFADSVQRIDEKLETKHLQPGQIFQLPQGKTIEELEHYVLSLGAFWPSLDKMGFLAQVMHDPEKAAKRAKRRKVVIPIAILAIVLSTIAGALGFRVYRLSNELTMVKAYNESESVLEACERYDRVMREINIRRRLQSEAEKLKQTIGGYPVVNSQIEAVVASCADSLVYAEIVSYRSDEGILTISTTADQVEKIHLFVGRLEDQELFKEIEYTGYRQTSEGKWVMTIECEMMGIQEEDDDAETDREG